MHILDRLTWHAFQAPTRRTELGQALIHANTSDFSSESIAAYKERQADLYTTVSGWRYYAVRMMGHTKLWNFMCCSIVIGFLLACVSTIGLGLVALFVDGISQMALISFVLTVIFALICSNLVWLENELLGKQVARWHVVDWDKFGGDVPDDVKLMARSVKFFLPKAKCRVHVLKTNIVVDPILEIDYGAERKFLAVWEGKRRVWQI